MDEKLLRIEKRVTSLESRVSVAENNIASLKDDIKSIKNNTQWILRLVLGAIITALIGLIINGGV